MSEIRRIASPDGRYELLLASNEMRMSHWVTRAALWERASQRLLLRRERDLMALHPPTR